jgi:hypothetical protein
MYVFYPSQGEKGYTVYKADHYSVHGEQIYEAGHPVCGRQTYETDHHPVSGKQIYEANLSSCICKEIYLGLIITLNIWGKRIYEVYWKIV